MAAQYSFVMKGLTKTYQNKQKPVLENINLQFYPDAKIGIVGPNGVGKSTLMKIMAGQDTDFTGEAWAGEGITVPLSAISVIGTDPHVFVVVDGMAEARAVETGALLGEDVILYTELTGEIIRDARGVRDGEKVKIQ